MPSLQEFYIYFLEISFYLVIIRPSDYEHFEASVSDPDVVEVEPANDKQIIEVIEYG